MKFINLTILTIFILIATPTLQEDIKIPLTINQFHEIFIQNPQNTYTYTLDIPKQNQLQNDPQIYINFQNPEQKQNLNYQITINDNTLDKQETPIQPYSQNLLSQTIQKSQQSTIQIQFSLKDDINTINRAELQGLIQIVLYTGTTDEYSTVTLPNFGIIPIDSAQDQVDSISQNLMGSQKRQKFCILANINHLTTNKIFAAISINTPQNDSKIRVAISAQSIQEQQINDIQNWPLASQLSSLRDFNSATILNKNRMDSNYLAITVLILADLQQNDDPISFIVSVQNIAAKLDNNLQTITSLANNKIINGQIFQLQEEEEQNQNFVQLFGHLSCESNDNNQQTSVMKYQIFKLTSDGDYEQETTEEIAHFQVYSQQSPQNKLDQFIHSNYNHPTYYVIVYVSQTQNMCLVSLKYQSIDQNIAQILEPKRPEINFESNLKGYILYQKFSSPSTLSEKDTISLRFNPDSQINQQAIQISYQFLPPHITSLPVTLSHHKLYSQLPCYDQQDPQQQHQQQCSQRYLEIPTQLDNTLTHYEYLTLVVKITIYSSKNNNINTLQIQPTQPKLLQDSFLYKSYQQPIYLSKTFPTFKLSYTLQELSHKQKQSLSVFSAQNNLIQTDLQYTITYNTETYTQTSSKDTTGPSKLIQLPTCTTQPCTLTILISPKDNELQELPQNLASQTLYPTTLFQISYVKDGLQRKEWSPIDLVNEDPQNQIATQGTLNVFNIDTSYKKGEILVLSVYIADLSTTSKLFLLYNSPSNTQNNTQPQDYPSMTALLLDSIFKDSDNLNSQLDLLHHCPLDICNVKATLCVREDTNQNDVNFIIQSTPIATIPNDQDNASSSSIYNLNTIPTPSIYSKTIQTNHEITIDDILTLSFDKQKQQQRDFKLNTNIIYIPSDESTHSLAVIPDFQDTFQISIQKPLKTYYIIHQFAQHKSSDPVIQLKQQFYQYKHAPLTNDTQKIDIDLNKKQQTQIFDLYNMKNHELLLTVDKPPVDLTVRYSLFKGDEPMNYPYNGRNRNVLSDQTIKANDELEMTISGTSELRYVTLEFSIEQTQDTIFSMNINKGLEKKKDSPNNTGLIIMLSITGALVLGLVLFFVIKNRINKRKEQSSYNDIEYQEDNRISLQEQ